MGKLVKNCQTVESQHKHTLIESAVAIQMVQSSEASISQFLERQELDLEHENWFAITGTLGIVFIGNGVTCRGISGRSVEH